MALRGYRHPGRVQALDRTMDRDHRRCDLLLPRSSWVCAALSRAAAAYARSVVKATIVGSVFD